MTFHIAKRPVRIRIVSVLLLAMIIGSVSSVFAESSDYKKRPLDARVDRLERLMSSQKQLELLYRMKQLQEENQKLRSLLEEQSNEIRLLKQQQRDLYADLNRRLNQMEGGVTPSTGSISGSTPDAIKKDAETMLIPENKAVEVIDKSSIKQSRYGVTERAEVPAAADKPAVATIKPMSKKELKAEQKAYQKAYDELRALRYNKARDSFTQFLQQYPSGRYAHIAQYWVAESSYAQRNYEQAIIDYQRLLDVYPFSPKKAEAELKKAYSYYELGEKEKARRTLDDLLRTFPDTTEAGQAKRLIKKL